MHRHGYIGRKMRLPELSEKPAVIMAAFGSRGRGKVALNMVKERMNTTFPEYQVYWSYSSAILRHKKQLQSLHQALAQAEADGYKRIVVQPLHVFPGTEYQQIAETCEYFPGVRVFLSETLMHRWDYIRKTLDVVAKEFLPSENGMNLLALHGTPLAADPVNIAYLGLERLVTDLYPNVMVASIEGMPDFEALFARCKQSRISHTYQRIRIIPMMFLAGVHVEDDIMGLEQSWRNDFESLGMDVECPLVQYNQTAYLKGLGFYPEVMDFLMERLARTIELARCH